MNDVVVTEQGAIVKDHSIYPAGKMYPVKYRREEDGALLDNDVDAGPLIQSWIEQYRLENKKFTTKLNSE